MQKSNRGLLFLVNNDNDDHAGSNCHSNDDKINNNDKEIERCNFLSLIVLNLTRR